MYFMAVKKSNDKRRARNINEPHGHNFEAVAHLKQFSITFRLGNSERPSFVFKTSKLKALFALNMDETKDHIFSKKFCFFFLFDGKVKRCNGFVSLTTSVYHPIIRKLVALVTMKWETEDACNVELFWSCFNEVLRKTKKDDSYILLTQEDG